MHSTSAPQHPLFLTFTALLLAAGCADSRANRAPSDTATNDTATNDTAANDADSGGPDDKGCCPADSATSGCMHLGGWAGDAGASACVQTCDFWCSTDWKLDTDTHGCAVWTYKIRQPGPCETALCLPNGDTCG